MKIERIDTEIARVKGKISDYQSRLRELEKQKTEAENLEIVALVRGVGIPHGELAAAIALLRQNRGLPVPAGVRPAPDPDPEE
jgi:hypothetical protein